MKLLGEPKEGQSLLNAFTKFHVPRSLSSNNTIRPTKHTDHAGCGGCGLREELYPIMTIA